MTRITLRGFLCTLFALTLMAAAVQAEPTDVLQLNVTPDSIYVQPGETVTVKLDVSNLQQEVVACQAVIGYDKDLLAPISVVKGGAPWNQMLYSSWAAGNLDVAVGVPYTELGGSAADATVAVITFQALAEGTTQVVFRPDGDDVSSTWLVDASEIPNVVMPTKLNSQTIIIDGMGPDKPTISASPSDWTSESTVTLEFSSSGDTGSGIAGYELKITKADGTLVQDWFSAASPNALDVSGYDDGEYKAYVRATDNAGNVSEVSDPAIFKLDKTAPTDVSVSADPVSWTSANSVTLSFASNCGVSGLNHYEVSVDLGGFTNVGSGSSYVLDVELLGDGTHSVTVKAVDNAANSTTAGTTIYIDRTPPETFTPTADPSTYTNAATIEITFSTTDATSDVDHYEVAVDSGTYTTWTSPYALPTDGLSDGPHTVHVKAIDLALNERICDVTIKIDKTDPLVSIDAITQGGPSVMLPGGAVALQGLVEITVSASDGTSGLAAAPSVSVQFSSGDPVPLSTTDTTSPFTYVASITSSTPNGVATINASVSDNAGNSSVATAKTFNVNKNQIAGTVELEDLNPPDSPLVSRTVVFVGSTGKTWNVSVDFAPHTSTGTFTLTDVPDSTSMLSAKTAWNLRRRVGVTAGDNGQDTADFTGSNKLLGGDLNGTNSINILDYAVLKRDWYTHAAGADIDGDGAVSFGDYTIMIANWFKKGDAE